MIYESNFDVDSVVVERMLKPQSLVPTLVRIKLLRASGIHYSVFRVPIQGDFRSLVSIAFHCLQWT
jgi:hypothetical protein